MLKLCHEKSIIKIIEVCKKSGTFKIIALIEYKCFSIAKNNKFKFMVNCIHTYKLILAQEDCKNYESIMKKASFIFKQSRNSLKLFFLNDNGIETEI